VQRGVAATAFVTPSEMMRRAALQGERREVDYAVIPMEGFLADVSIDDARIQAYYDDRPAEFMTPETVDLEFIELRLADVESEVQVDDEALLAYYEQVKERFAEEERRRGRHILIAVDDTTDDAAAKAKVEEALAKLQAGGDFATLAKEYSNDPVSAEKGGDLDWATRGMFVGPFEDALFAMNEGELRGPVRTEFGYHILRLDDVEGGDVKSFADVRAELAQDFRSDQSQKLFYERSQKLADEAFAVLTELTSVSESLNLPLQRVQGFTRQGGGVLGAEPKLIDAAFRPEAIEKRENSPLITLTDDHVVVLRVAAHHASERLPLAAVRTQIETRLRLQAARDAAAQRGAELLARLEGGAAWAAGLAESKLATIGKRTIGRDDGSVPAPVRTAAFAVPRSAVTQAKPVYRGAVMEDGGYAVIAVSAVESGSLELATPDGAAQLRQAAQSQGELEFGAYLGALERDAKILRNPRVFE
jgi:peptidyl-prolyl cis-trans isomerase D